MNLYILNDASGRAAVYGIKTYLRELTREIRFYDVKVTVVHIFSEKPELEMIEQEGIQHWYIPSLNKKEQSRENGKRDLLYYKNIVYLLRRKISKNTVKLIFQLNFNYCQVLAEGLKEAFECKLVWVGHYLNWSISLRGNLEHLKSMLSKPQKERDNVEQAICYGFEEEKKLLKTVDHIISLTTYMKNLFCEEYGIDAAKISVIPNGLADTSKDVLTDKIQLRTQWKFSANEKLILFAGRLDIIKGLDYLIQAFREVLNVIPNSRLMIVGDGPYNFYLRKSIDICSKITYSGLVSQSELSELYHIADIGIIPSLYEPFGYVALEMMMHGLPMITTATSGLNELLEEGKCALKVPIHFGDISKEIDILLLAQKIVFLLKNPYEANRLKINARKRYEKQYTTEVAGQNMFQFYKSLYV